MPNRAPSKKPKPPVDVDWPSALARLRAALGARHALAPKDLTALGIPKPLHADAVARLAAAGLEPTAKGGVRAPLRDQLVDALRARGTVAVGALGKVVAGATGAEAKKVALALVGEATLRLVRRGKVDVVAAPDAAVLDDAELRSLARATKALAAQCDNAIKARALGKTLLRDDVRELLLDVVVRASASPPPQRDVAADALDALKRSTRADLGLAFVPDVVRALAPAHSVHAIHAALLALARAGRVELRPESGLGRLGAEDRALCPVTSDLPLSWARPLESTP
jgi:hypothetical protein